MIMHRWLVPFLVAFAIAKAALAAATPDVRWQSFDTLSAIDRSLAEGAMADMLGDDPQLWPDWLDPRAALIPAERGRSAVLVVREPYRAPCGQYRFIIFGPAASDGSRPRLGDGFCAGALTVIPVAGRAVPDLLFAEGSVRQGEGEWHRQDQRVRWTGQDWVRIVER